MEAKIGHLTLRKDKSIDGKQVYALEDAMFVSDFMSIRASCGTKREIEAFIKKPRLREVDCYNGRFAFCADKMLIERAVDTK